MIQSMCKAQQTCRRLPHLLTMCAVNQTKMPILLLLILLKMSFRDEFNMGNSRPIGWLRKDGAFLVYVLRARLLKLHLDLIHNPQIQPRCNNILEPTSET